MATVSANKSIIFDLDGTIWNSIIYSIKAWQLAFKDYGIDTDPEVIRLMIGYPGSMLSKKMNARDPAIASGFIPVLEISFPVTMENTIIPAANATIEIPVSRYRRPDVKVDYVGAIALGVPLALIVLAMSEGSSWGWHSILFLQQMPPLKFLFPV